MNKKILCILAPVLAIAIFILLFNIISIKSGVPKESEDKQTTFVQPTKASVASTENSSQSISTSASETTTSSETTGSSEETTLTPAEEDSSPSEETTTSEETTIEATASVSPGLISEEIFQTLFEQIDSGNVVRLSVEQIVALRTTFDKSVLLGDSMAQAALEYGLLDDSHVFFKRSASIGELTDTITSALGMYPEKIVFFTGLNDTNTYPVIEDFIAAYKAQIDYIRSVLPNVKIYISSLLPPADELAAVRDDLARAPLYDAALSSMCKELGITYIDTNWMVRRNLYNDDLYHMNFDFYQIYLQYICNVIA